MGKNNKKTVRNPKTTELIKKKDVRNDVKSIT
jgi:hypothetical protein